MLDLFFIVTDSSRAEAVHALSADVAHLLVFEVKTLQHPVDMELCELEGALVEALLLHPDNLRGFGNGDQLFLYLDRWEWSKLLYPNYFYLLFGILQLCHDIEVDLAGAQQNLFGLWTVELINYNRLETLARGHIFE